MCIELAYIEYFDGSCRGSFKYLTALHVFIISTIVWKGVRNKEGIGLYCTSSILNTCNHKGWKLKTSTAIASNL